MSTGAIVAIVVVVIVVAAVLVVMTAMNRRHRLQERFGPEYDRAVTEHGSRREAEAELAERERHVRGLDIRPLSQVARTQYMSEWTAVQEQFVDAPQAAVTGAQTLVSAVMEDRGYPTQPYDQTLADLSVEHASTLDHFRAAHDISQNAAAGAASTEDLRQAMIHYRALFAELLGEPAGRLGSRAGGESVTTTQPDGLPPVDQRPVDQAPAGQPAEDQRAVDERAVDERAVDERAVDERAVDQPAVDQAAGDQAGAPAGPGAPAETPSQAAGDRARNRTPDAVTTARRPER
jgi:hypothetical protein